ncbi:hypothetical protein TNCV_2871641 [Trichonephila clavipes]|nr:hypothetical protein TNCV_2871641 [Trichonephila clavipes]
MIDSREVVSGRKMNGVDWQRKTSPSWMEPLDWMLGAKPGFAGGRNTLPYATGTLIEIMTVVPKPLKFLYRIKNDRIEKIGQK